MLLFLHVFLVTATGLSHLQPVHFYHVFSLILFAILHQLRQSIPQSVQVIFYPTRHKLQRSRKILEHWVGMGALVDCKYTKGSICVLRNREQVTVVSISVIMRKLIRDCGHDRNRNRSKIGICPVKTVWKIVGNINL